MGPVVFQTEDEIAVLQAALSAYLKEEERNLCRLETFDEARWRRFEIAGRVLDRMDRDFARREK